MRKTIYQMFRDEGFTVGAEVGVGYATNAVDILETMPEVKLYLIDPWTGTARTPRFYRTVHRRAMKNLGPYKDRTVVMHMTSELAASDFDEGSLDFVYIDGDHSYDAVMLDIILWGRRVKSGGLLAGHDYVRTTRHGVARAANDYARYHRLDLQEFKGNWYWRVP